MKVFQKIPARIIPFCAALLLAVMPPAGAYAASKAPKGSRKLAPNQMFIVQSGKKRYLCGQMKKWEPGKLTGKGKAFFLPLRVEISRISTATRSRGSQNRKLKKMKDNYKKGKTVCAGGPPPSGPTPLPGPPAMPPAIHLAPHTAPLTVRDIHHLYRRAGLGVPPPEAYSYAGRQASELAAFFMTYTEEPEVEEEAQMWLDGSVDAPHYPDSNITAAGINMYGLRTLVKTRNQFHERLAWLSLHDRLATSSLVVNGDASQRPLMLQHLNLIRQTGSREMDYWKLVENIGEDAVMMKWLSLDKNTKKAPNENYARELMELFTLDSADSAGQPNYTNLDIIQVSRAFTGWTIFKVDNIWSVLQIIRNTDTDPNKIIFQGTPYQGTVQTGRDVVRHIFAAHPNAGPSLAKWIAREYLHEHASPGVIDEMAGVLRASRFNLRPVFERLLSSAEFYKPSSEFTIAKSPVERFVHLMRIMDLVSMPYDFPAVRNSLTGMGCILTQTETVFGCDKLEELPDGQRLLNSVNLVTSLSNNNGLFSNRSWTYSSFFPPTAPAAPNPAQLMNRFEELFGFNLTPPQRIAAGEYMTTVMNNNGSITPEPWNPAGSALVRRKVAGLFRMFAGMPQFHDLR